MRHSATDTCRLEWAFAIGALVVLLAACNASGPVSPTALVGPKQAAVPVTVRQLIDGSDKYSERRISLTGQIAVECPEGCWFFLDDGTGKIYVDLKPAGLTIPQKVGSRVRLLGKTKGSAGNLQVLGDEVEFPDEH